MEITREISITPKIIISSFLLCIAHLADILPLESPFLHHLGVFLIEGIKWYQSCSNLAKTRKQGLATSESSLAQMDAQFPAMVEQQMETQRQRIDEVSSTHQQIMEKFAELTKERQLEVNEEISSNVDRNSFRFLPNLEFPSFDGCNPRNWVKKCPRYFALCKIPDAHRVDVASIHLTGKAETWFASYIAVRKNVDWSDFIVDLCNRFRKELGSKIVEDFHKLHQLGSVEEYLEKFEDLKSLLL